MSSSSKFTRAGVREYEKRRYRGLDQRIVHAREMNLIRRVLALVDADRVVRDDQAGKASRVVCDGQAGEVGRAVRANRRLALDLPCGYGRFTPMLRERGFNVVNADLSIEMARRAGENATINPQDSGGRPTGDGPGPGTWFPALAADANRLPFQPGVFDLVFSIRFFHHVHTPEGRAAILREFSRVSSEYTIVSFYRANGLHAVQRRLRRVFGKSRTNIKMVEAGVFEKAAGEAGFKIVRILPLFRGIHAYHLALLRKMGTGARGQGLGDRAKDLSPPVPT